MTKRTLIFFFVFIVPGIIPVTAQSTINAINAEIIPIGWSRNGEVLTFVVNTNSFEGEDVEIFVYNVDVVSGKSTVVAHGVWDDSNGPPIMVPLEDRLAEMGVVPAADKHDSASTIPQNVYSYKVYRDTDRGSRMIIANSSHEVKVLPNSIPEYSSFYGAFENPQHNWAVIVTNTDYEKYTYSFYSVSLESGFVPVQTWADWIMDKDLSQDERVMYVGLLAAEGSDFAAKYMLELLQRTESDVRLAVIKAVGEMNLPEAAGPLLQMMDGHVHRVKFTAAVSLQKLAGPEDVDELAHYIHSDISSSIKIKLINGLGRIGGEEVLGPLAECLEDRDYKIREAAVEAIGNTGSPAAADVLISAMSDSSTTVKQHAIDALVETGDLRVLRILREILAGDDRRLYSAAVRGMKQLAGPQEEQLLIDLCSKTTDRRLTYRIYSTLGDIGGSATIDYALKQMSESSRYWRVVSRAIQSIIVRDRDLARNFLSRLEGPENSEAHLVFNAIYQMEFRNIKDVLLDGLSHAPERARADIAYSIGLFARKQFAMKRCDNDPTADEMHELLVVALKGNSPLVRWAAAGSLGSLVREDGVAVLETLFSDPHERVAEKARESLAQLKKYLEE